jgi:hypothetical protein
MLSLTLHQILFFWKTAKPSELKIRNHKLLHHYYVI